MYKNLDTPIILHRKSLPRPHVSVQKENVQHTAN